MRAQPQGPGRAAGLRALRRDGPLRAMRRGGDAPRPTTQLGCRRCGTVRPPVCLSCGGHGLQEPATGRDPGARGARGPGPRAGGRDQRRDRGRGRRWAGTGRGGGVRGHRGGAAPAGVGRRGRVPRLRPGAAGAPLPGRRGGPGPAGAGRPPPGWAAGRAAASSSRPGCPTTRSCRPRCWGIRPGWPTAELARRRLLRYPPLGALATVSGAGRARRSWRAWARPGGVEVLGPSDGQWLLRADDHRPAARRPGGHAPPARPPPHRRRPPPALTTAVPDRPSGPLPSSAGAVAAQAVQASAADLVHGDGGGHGHVERADGAQLGQVADVVAAGQAGLGQAAVLVADGQADVGGQVELVQRAGLVGQLDADQGVAAAATSSAARSTSATSVQVRNRCDPNAVFWVLGWSGDSVGGTNHRWSTR